MVIVTPVWKPVLTVEERALVGITDRMNADVDRAFCAPEGLDVSAITSEFPDWRVERFPAGVFASVHSYSAWMTSPDLYAAFGTHELLTMCQTDAVLVRDVRGVEMYGIDYVGAPWVPPVCVLAVGNRVYVASDFDRREGPWWARAFGRRLHVGNGGLSTRRVEAFLSLTTSWQGTLPDQLRRTVLEDVLFCSIGARSGLTVATLERARATYAETEAATWDALPDVLGFHGLRRWNPTLADELLRRYAE